MPRGNKNPVQTKEFKEKQFQAYGEVGEVPLSKKVTGVKLPEDIDAVIRSMPDKERVAWLRRVIVDAAQKELIQQN
ncbi:hypothetical protein [Leptolyngbya ohadii]|uniref:hypothetical protein n=1 Tax=Leptolyngbya ohadii TaxID=1962290 RepID=UPI000B59C7E8|nr:hypothetical protein [Leptolyngbya ohadii]